MGGGLLLWGEIGSCDMWRKVDCWVYLRNSVRLVEFVSWGIQVEGMQYAGRLVVRSWFLKWNCFFVVCVRWLANFRTRWCVGAGDAGKSWDLRQVLQFQWGIVGGRRDFLWLYSSSPFLVLGGLDAWCFWRFSLYVIPGRVSWVKVWIMVAWVVLSLPRSRSHFYSFCCCIPRKEGGDIWWRSRCLVSA